MKKLFKLISIAPVTIAASIPAISAASCSKTLLQTLEQSTIYEFKQLAKIPHSSDEILYKVPYNSNVLQLSNYLMKRVEQLTGAKVWQDKYANLWFDIPCNDDKYKDYPTIALQAHMDMVFTFDPTKYEKDPDPKSTIIELVEETKDGKRVIHSKDYKTTIGADDGIGVAAILALISNKDVKHGNLRVIFTNCEENALQGAMMLIEGRKDDATKQLIDYPTAPEILHNIKYVINMDGGIGNSITVSCSGAVGSRYSKKYSASNVSLPNKFELSVTGFTGGHSAGAPRNNLGNAIKAATEVIAGLNKDIEISSILSPGTTVYNRVAQNCTIKFATNATLDELNASIAKVKTYHSDPEGDFYYKDLNKTKFEAKTCDFDKVLSKQDSKSIINLHSSLFYGFNKKDLLERQIKTSANIGPSTLVLNNNEYEFKTATYSRSDDENRVAEFKTSNVTAAAENNIDYMCDAQFHPWVEDTNKSLLNLTKQALVSVGIDESKIKLNKAHSGLEPSWWSYAMKNIEHINDGACTCLGVNVSNEHEFTETIDVESIQKCMNAAMYIFNNANKLA